MKRILVFVFALCLVALFGGAASAGSPRVILDGSVLSFDVPPVIENGRTLVPMRTIFEALDAEISWDENSRKVKATRPGTEIEIIIGGEFATINNRGHKLDVPAKIISGRTMVPLRFVSESMGCDVQWDGQKSMITISSSGVLKTQNLIIMDLLGSAVWEKNTGLAELTIENIVRNKTEDAPVYRVTFKKGDGTVFNREFSDIGGISIAEMEESYFLSDPSTLFTKTIFNAIKNKSVLIGMTKDEVELAWGKPDKIGITMTSRGDSEQWTYGSKNLYFSIYGLLYAIEK